MILIVESKYGIVQINDSDTPITYEDIGKACELCDKDSTREFALWDNEMITKYGSYTPTMRGVFLLTYKISELQD